MAAAAEAYLLEREQLGLYGEGPPSEGLQRDRPQSRAPQRRPRPAIPLCAGCRAKEARYGFQDPRELGLERPRTLCFECFRVEITRRQQAAARLAHGWNAEQVGLPLLEEALSENAMARMALANALEDANRRRRRAQIAARHALGL